MKHSPSPMVAVRRLVTIIASIALAFIFHGDAPVSSNSAVGRHDTNLRQDSAASVSHSVANSDGAPLGPLVATYFPTVRSISVLVTCFSFDRTIEKLSFTAYIAGLFSKGFSI